MASKPSLPQSKLTDFYRQARSRRSPSPKRAKPVVENRQTTTVTRRSRTAKSRSPATVKRTVNRKITAYTTSRDSSPAVIRLASPPRAAAVPSEQAIIAPPPPPATPRRSNLTPSASPTISRTSAISRVAILPEIVPSLELPPTFSLLMNWFSSADQLVSIMYNRQELITFTKLQAGVQKVTRRNFGLKQLGQIKAVYPEAYEYEQIRTTRQASIMQNRRQDYELTIKPNLATDLSAYGLKTPMKSPRKRLDVTPTKSPPRTPVKRPYFALSPTRTPTKRTPPKLNLSTSIHFLDTPPSPSKAAPVAGAVKPFTGGRLVLRNQVFRRNLFGILRERHKEFLGALSPPIRLSDDEERQLTSWHPQFLVNEQALEIPLAPLPEPPTVEKIACAKDLINISKIGLHPKVEAAIANVTETRLESEPVEASAEASASTTAPKKPSSIKGIPPKLLEKIREKERQKKQLAMLRTPEEDTRRLRLSRLPDFVRIINMYFATESKSVLPLAQVHQKLSDSYGSPMTAVEIVEHVKLLREIVPDWISQTELGEKGSYLRMNREFEVSEVLKILEKQQ